MSTENLPANLLRRLCRQSALYVFGSGASAPIVPLAPALMQRTAKAFIELGSFAPQLAPPSVITARIQQHAVGNILYDNQLRPGTEEPPIREILGRLTHCFANAEYTRQLTPRLAGIRSANYSVLRAFRPSILLNYNLDGLASHICGNHHFVLPMHGSVAPEHGGLSGDDLIHTLQASAFKVSRGSLHPIGPESITDQQLRRRLSYINRCDPAFVMIVGYTFGKIEGGHDDAISLSTFIGRFRNVPIDVYVCDPHPFELAGMLAEELRSKRIYAISMFWNILAWGFIQALMDKLDFAHLELFCERTLDRAGPNFNPIRD